MPGGQCDIVLDDQINSMHRVGVLSMDGRR
jgi:hypothetical protein